MKNNPVNTFIERIGENNVLSSFVGEISEQRVNEILMKLEKLLEESEPEFKKQRKVYNILVEMLQNLYHHTGKGTLVTIIDQDTNREVAFAIGKKDEDYNILAANYIENSRIEKLKNRLEKINSMEKEELRSFYKEVLNNGEYSVHGGGGLGMIDIARKSGNPLGFDFQEVNNDYSIFSLTIIV